MVENRGARTLAEQFGEDYRIHQDPVMLDIERVVCGCDYGGTSWATRAEANQVCRLLGLNAGTRLLEVGAGSGWPGLYFARTTGCLATLVDLPLAGIRIAAERIGSDQLRATCSTAVADGTALPFNQGMFDALSHSDVLCCLEDKTGFLGQCRQVIRAGGRMVFSVINIAPHLAQDGYARALESGPPHVASECSYKDLLHQSGWTTETCIDLSAAFAQTRRHMLRAQKQRVNELARLLGAAEVADRIERNRMAVAATESGLLQRSLFVATAG